MGTVCIVPVPRLPKTVTSHTTENVFPYKSHQLANFLRHTNQVFLQPLHTLHVKLCSVDANYFNPVETNHMLQVTHKYHFSTYRINWVTHTLPKKVAQGGDV